ncbi:uncharacterized protein K452DRAFT_240854 [Aplosporella prunicola CBS 121167]|uniref:AD domain-containing protein n=1 Tax=Aplosporella prunicola CBS 121167 TaxID=1176127 RepID=A0A6A6BTH0_9PEZI|nr:uncharacterized protein K452DRAFT_240854 [Aplosporella prunicola CBS 121167]KAF2147412.1 hypothetical protein K452DRAFT_240854 [Aplosporella prunicola CBS 121167]
MADGKRLSTAGKVATPKVGDQSILNDSHLVKAIGKRVKVSTSIANNVVEGTLFVADPISNTIAVNTVAAAPHASQQPGNYTVISIPHIQDFKIVTDDGAADPSATGFDTALPPIAPLDLGALKAREEAQVRKLMEKEATRGKGVPKEAQEIFDAINRTLPTRWHEQSIVINDAVILGPPYTINDLKAEQGKERNVEQIRKIMDSFFARKKAAQQGGNRPGVVTPIAPKKGG